MEKDLLKESHHPVMAVFKFIPDNSFIDSISSLTQGIDLESIVEHVHF